MKRLFAAFVALACILTFVGCTKNDSPSSSIISEPQIQSDIKRYFSENLEYTLKDLRVVKEDDKSFTVVSTLGSEYNIDDFIPYVEQMIHISEEAAEKFNVTFSCINPTMYIEDSAWIGWSNDSLNFYDQDHYLVEDVTLDMLKNEVEKYKIQNGYGNLAQEPSESFPTMSYNEMKYEIEHYLDNHNDLSKIYGNVTVRKNNGKLEFEITLQAYETYTFAAVTCAATDIVRTLVEDNGIEEYRLWVHSPSDANYTIHWISFNLEIGVIDDKGPNGRYNENIMLDAMLKHYGYEDFQGSFSDFLNGQSGSSADS